MTATSTINRITALLLVSSKEEQIDTGDAVELLGDARDALKAQVEKGRCLVAALYEILSEVQDPDKTYLQADAAIIRVARRAIRKSKAVRS